MVGGAPFPAPIAMKTLWKGMDIQDFGVPEPGNQDFRFGKRNGGEKRGQGGAGTQEGENGWGRGDLQSIYKAFTKHF